ncbi:hypothetical protein D3C75_1195390 [compost metagenome]
MSPEALWPGHAQPAARTQFTAELGIGAVPALGAFMGGKIFQRFSEKFAHLGAQGVRTGVQMTGTNIECLHGF